MSNAKNFNIPDMNVIQAGPNIKNLNKIRREMERSERKTDYRSCISKWVRETSFMEFREYMSSRVKGQEELDKVLINIYTYLEVVSRPESISIPHNNNMLIAAPSGCGKTETYRALRDYFKEKLPHLPILQVDMTSITEEGYKGADTSAVVAGLETSYNTQGMGIIFMDEFDKKLIPSYNSKGGDVNHAVQAQLLTTIEGREFPEFDIDTTNTLFIGLGSFDDCRAKKDVEIKHIGFGQENEAPSDHYTEITREDMIELGATYELLGRFSTVINYHKLDYETVDNIINDNLFDIGRTLLVHIELSDEFRQKVHDIANSKYGCRMIKSTLNNAIMNGYLAMKLRGTKKKNCVMTLYDENNFSFHYPKTSKAQ